MATICVSVNRDDFIQHLPDSAGTYSILCPPRGEAYDIP